MDWMKALTISAWMKLPFRDEVAGVGRRENCS
jgi:hypothetical protein